MRLRRIFLGGKMSGVRRDSLYRSAIAIAALVFTVVEFDSRSALADTVCRELRVSLQPDCFRPSLQSNCNKRRSGSQLDLGPQLAVWVTDQDGKFVDTIMVTALTGTRGIGNRPGRWDFRSAPRFPYGRRSNVLPVWAWARGKLYSQVVMQDGKEDGLGFHESVSSPDPYYCRPMGLSEVDVDAITCPTAVFSSAKGRFDSSRNNPYPPRNDLFSFTDRDCDEPFSKAGSACAKSAMAFAMVNDLDAVSRATPSYGKPYEIRRRLPQSTGPGNFFLNVEINKEFDQNANHAYSTFQDPQLPESGIETNIGQPSVVFQIPFLVGETSQYFSTNTAKGYGDWDGHSGVLHPLDVTISSSPGSGLGRLLSFRSSWTEGEGVEARVHVMTSGCGAVDVFNPDGGQSGDGGQAGCSPVSAPTNLEPKAVRATSATLRFAQGGEGDNRVLEYEIRYVEGPNIDEASFSQGIPVGVVEPGTPGSSAEVLIWELKPSTRYTLGIRAKGSCGNSSQLESLSFETPAMVFQQLSGCFIATASFGSPLSDRISSLRWMRDVAVLNSPLANESVKAYYRSSPVFAAALATSSPARALVRVGLDPIVDLAEAIRSLAGNKVTVFSPPNSPEPEELAWIAALFSENVP